GHVVMLVVAQRRRLARRPARDDRVGAVLDVELDELLDLRLVDLAVAEWGHHRDDRALEGRFHALVSPREFRRLYVMARRRSPHWSAGFRWRATRCPAPRPRSASVPPARRGP